MSEDINLNDIDPTVKKLRIAAGWDLKQYEGETVDVDLSCFLLDKNGQTTEDADFIFYNNMKSADLAVRHQGDNITDIGDRDDEAIIVDIAALPYDIYKIVFAVSIYMADERDHTFKRIENAFIRVVNEDTFEEMARDDLTETFDEATAVKFCELERVGTDWHFRTVKEPTQGGLKSIAEEYGCIIASIG